MVLGDVEENITVVEFNEETNEEYIRVKKIIKIIIKKKIHCNCKFFIFYL